MGSSVVRMGLLLIAIAVVALAALLLIIAASRQRRSTSHMVDVLLAAASRVAPSGPRTAGQLDALPAPVARYLRHVLPDEWTPIRVARFRQGGELRTDPKTDRWWRFEATQIVVPPVSGFVWDARVQIAPLLHVRVRDALVDGQASGRVSLLSAIPVASDSARHEIDSGSLHRYLAEAVWYPTALWPSAALQWTAIDDTKAMATVTHAGVTVSLEFWFNDAGEVTGIYAPDRWGRFYGEYRQTPWEGHFSSYVERDGMLVPTEGEVGWYSGGAWEAVWRGRVIEASYEFAR